MYYIVYRIINLLNGKFYIGCHKTENKDDGYMGSGVVLKKAIRKYGLENFKKDILFEGSSLEEMFAKEKELVVLGPQSYNLKHGGDGGWDYIHNKFNMSELGRLGYNSSLKYLTKQNRKIIHIKSGREYHKKNRNCDWYKSEQIRRASLGGRVSGKLRKGINHTEETKRKISLNRKGKNIGQIPWNKGKKLAE